MDNNEEVKEEKIEEQLAEVSEQKAEEKTKKNIPLIVIMVGIAIGLCLAIGIALMDRNKQSSKPKENKEQEQETIKDDTSNKEEDNQETEQKEEQANEPEQNESNESANDVKDKNEQITQKILELEKERANKQTEYDELIGYVPVPSLLDWSDNGFLNKKLTVSDLDLDHLIFKAMSKLQKEEYPGWQELVSDEKEGKYHYSGEIYAYKVADVKKSLENMYGTSLSLKDVVQYNTDNPTWFCLRKDDDYVCDSESGYAFFGPVSLYFEMGYDLNIRKYDKKEIDGNNLYLYVKYARVVIDAPESYSGDWKPEDITLKIYKYGNGSDLIASANGKDFYDENPTMLLDDKLYEKYGNKFTEYKITYEKNGNNYTFVSVEPV